jgi:hypothetical protein
MAIDPVLNRQFQNIGRTTMPVSPLSTAAALVFDSSVHPLDAPPEQKLFHPQLGRMFLTRRAKLALFLVQGYLGIMVLLVGWRLIAGT